MEQKTSEILKAIKASHPKGIREDMLVAHICKIIAPYCSVLFIKWKMSPNQVTMLMIAFGIVGSVLFGLPNVWCKLVGALCWFLWFTMDVCDGEVARVTQTFSKFGMEMDYMAHLICHPLMNLAIWLTFESMDIMNPVLLSAIFMIVISAEMFNRNLWAFHSYEKRSSATHESTIKEVSWFKYIVGNIVLYPTLIVLFPWVLLVDYAWGNGFSMWLFMLWSALYLFMFVRRVERVLVHFYRD